ncbi:MAG: cell division protein FtsQ/DivIB [Solirubrobacteraceae bacterium]
MARRHRIKLAGALVALASLGGAWLWVRDSPVFAIQRVQVSGVFGASAGQVRSRLEDAARSMTTTHIDTGRLRAAVAPYAAVVGLKVDTQIPHGVRIAITEQPPVMALVVGGQRLPVAPNGLLLRGRLAASAAVPDVATSSVPSGGVLRDPSQLRALELLDIAPPALRARLWRVGETPQGLTAFVRGGPQIFFGDPSRLHAKWASAAQVLGDAGSRGARYIDVRAPERPAAQVADPATLRSPVLAGPQAPDAPGATSAPGAGIGTAAAGAAP